MGIDHGRNGIRGIVEAVHKLKGQRDQERQAEEYVRPSGTSSIPLRSRAMLVPMKMRPAIKTRPKIRVPVRLGPLLSFASITVDAEAAAIELPSGAKSVARIPARMMNRDQVADCEDTYTSEIVLNCYGEMNRLKQTAKLEEPLLVAGIAYASADKHRANSRFRNYSAGDVGRESWRKRIDILPTSP